jgi:hypothetical protein
VVAMRSMEQVVKVEGQSGGIFWSRSLKDAWVHGCRWVLEEPAAKTVKVPRQSGHCLKALPMAESSMTNQSRLLHAQSPHGPFQG